MATFKILFKNIYAEALNAEGFKYNSKYGYFFRIHNNELIQYITFINCFSSVKGEKCYNIFAGTVSIYSESVDKGFLRMAGTTVFDYTRDIKHKLGFKYVEEEKEMIESIKETLEYTVQYVIPVLNEVVDLKTYVLFRKKTNGLIEIGGANVFWADSLSLIMGDNHDDFCDIFDERLAFLNEQFQSGIAGGSYESQYNAIHTAIFETIVESRDKVYQDKQLYAEAIAEAERRKTANLEYLRSMKVID